MRLTGCMSGLSVPIIGVFGPSQISGQQKSLGFGGVNNKIQRAYPP
jgi:hypothetical protein